MSILDNRQQGLVSIVISSYNHQQYIIDALESLKKQSYSLIELIIVDDGSTDNTENIVSEWRAKNSSSFANFIYLKLPRNCYSSWALNIGFLISQGEYIVIHDADDISFPSKIEKQFKWLQDHPEIIAVGTNFWALEDQNKYQPAWLSFDRQQIDENYRKHNKHCVSFGTLMFRAETLNRVVGVQKNPDQVNDFKFLKEMITKNLIVDNLEEHLIYIRLHPGQLSYKYDKNFTEGIPVKEGSFKKIKDRVSIVIPVQNSDEKILRVLNLIAMQTYPELEIIIIDNKSNDNIESIVKKWYQQYQQNHSQKVVKEMLYFKMPVEIDFFRLYDIGSYLAKGEYIAYQGVNGVISRNRIKRQLEFLINNPAFSVVLTDYKGENIAKQTNNSRQLRIKLNRLLANRSNNMVVDKTVKYNLNTILLRSSVIDQTAGIGECQTEQLALEYLYRLLLKGYNIKFLDEILYYQI